MPDRRTPLDRRGRADRRRIKTRRQVDSDQSLVIEISDSMLAAVRLQRNDGDRPDVVSASTLEWRQNAPSLLTEAGHKELAAALREISKQNPGFSGGVHIVLSSEFCVTRAVRGSTEDVRSELQQLEQRSRLYLSLGPGEKVVVKTVRAVDARHQYALAAVCNQETLDALQAAADTAGLQIVSIEPALSAACRAASRTRNLPDETCVLIHIDPASAGIGVFRQGELLLEYRPGGQTEAADLPELLAEHLNRLQRHAGRQLGQAHLRISKVLLCGDATLVHGAMQAFGTGNRFEVRQLEPRDIQATWQFEDAAERAATVPALGALLATYLSPAERDAPNLMEHIIASSREPLQPTLIRSALPLVAMVLISVAMSFLNSSQQQQLDRLAAELDGLAPARAKAIELRLKLLAAEAKFKQLDLLASQLVTPIGKDAVAGIGNCLPSEVWLSGVELRDGVSVRISGSSFADAGVYDFVRWLEQAPHFKDVALKSTKPGMSELGNIVNFTLELRVGSSDDQARKVALRE